MSRSADHLIVSRAALNHGVVARSQLLLAGVSSASIDRRVGGILTPLLPGVYSVGATTELGWIAAALAAEPRSAAADLTAGRLLDLPVRRFDGVSIVVPESVRRTFPPGLQTRRTRHLPIEDITIVDGLRVTTVERTICDLANLVSARQLQRLIEVSIVQERTTASLFRACASSFCRRGRRGSARIRLLRHELLDRADISDSELEQRGVELLTKRGLTDFRLQHSPPWRDGPRGVVDIAWPEHRLILELDGRRWHTVTEAMQEDRRRDRRATSHGWVVVRAPWDEVVHRPDSLVSDLRELLASRAPRVSTEAARTVEDHPQK